MLQSVIDQVKNTKTAQLIESKLVQTKVTLTEQTSAEANKALNWVVEKLVSDQLEGESQAAVKAEIVSQIKSFDPRTLPELLKKDAHIKISIKKLPAEIKSLRATFAKKLVESAERRLKEKSVAN